MNILILVMIHSFIHSFIIYSFIHSLIELFKSNDYAAHTGLACFTDKKHVTVPAASECTINIQIGCLYERDLFNWLFVFLLIMHADSVVFLCI